MKIFGSITELVKVVLRKSGYAVTVEPSTASADTTFQLPAAGGGTKAIVTADSSNTLTNKTFDADGTGNSISNIENADIKAGAAIDATKIADGSVTNTEFQYIGGVTSDVQTQLNAKQATITGGASSITTSNLTASKALQSDASGKVEASSVTNTELGYVSGVTSGIQGQLNNKAASGANSDITSITGLTTALSIPQGGTGQTTQQAAINALVGTQTANRVLRSDGTNMSLSQVALGTDVSGQLPLANGGTGANYASSNALLNGVLPTQTGNANKFLKSDGTNTSWASAGGGVGKNYLQDFYDADSSITVQQSVGDTVGSSTRSNPGQFGSSTTADLISQSTNSSLRGTTNYLIAFTANAQFVETPLFTLDGSDLGKAMSVQMDVTGVSTDNDVQVYAVRYNSSNVLQERIPIAGSASSTTPFSAKLPTGTKTFNGFFIPSSTSSDKYAIRILRNANNTSMRIDALVVGPQQVLQGAIVTDWQSFTPTGSWTTGCTYAGKYRRVGECMELTYQVSVTGTPTATFLTLNMPSGFTIDTTKINVSDRSVVGSAFIRDGGARGYPATANYFTTTSFLIYHAEITGNGDSFVDNDSPITFASGDYVTASIMVPVSEFASANTQQAARAVEEYASNSTWDTDTNSLTAFVNGPQGSQMGGALTAVRTKRVRFQTPILPTDTLIFEVADSTEKKWVTLPASVGGRDIFANAIRNNAGTLSNGGVFMKAVASSTTDIDIVFNRYASTSPDFTSILEPWPSAAFWRLRKVSSGAAVGFPVGARNVVGDTTGTTVPAGYVGEHIESVAGSDVNMGSSTQNITSITLTTGVWNVHAIANINKGTATLSSTNWEAYLTLNSASSTGTTFGQSFTNVAIPTVNNSAAVLPLYRRIVVSAATQVVYLAANAPASSGNALGRGSIMATRIA